MISLRCDSLKFLFHRLERYSLKNCFWAGYSPHFTFQPVPVYQGVRFVVRNANDVLIGDFIHKNVSLGLLECELGHCYILSIRIS